jgi:D-serine ammonia-lyase
MVYIYGFYTHAGHSYSVASQAEAQAHLRNEIEHVRAAADLCRKLSSGQDLHLTLSIGATPTAHAAPIAIDSESQQEIEDPKTILELHAGNFAILDLQQTSTTLAPLSHIASWIEGEVLSVYPERRELLVNIGALGIGREPGREAGVWGLAKLVTRDCTEKEGEGYSWNLARLSQEHGILTPRDPAVGVGDVGVGTRVRVLPQHACIAGAMHEAYLVVEEEEGVCVDEWVRCRRW